MGNQPVTHDQIRHRDPAPHDRPVDLQPRRPEQRNKPPPGPGKSLRRRQLWRTRNAVAGRCFQLLSGHAAIGPYLKDMVRKTDSDKYWWCGGGSSKPATTSPPSADHGPPRLGRCGRQLGRHAGGNIQRPRRLSTCGRTSTRRRRRFWTFSGIQGLAMLNLRRLSGEEGGEGGEGEINEEDGPGPPWAVFLFSFLCFFPVSSLSLSFVQAVRV